MRVIAHLSDLHFGRTHAPTLEPLRSALVAARPDLVAVSGDLTQRARARQFQEARAFLDSLPRPQIVVPGNHDVPLYNLVARFTRPLGGYRRYIGDDLAPVYHDDEIAVLGVNTTRALAHKGGRINPGQIRHVCETFERLGEAETRILVTHHPFDLPPGVREVGHLVGRARMAMAAFARCGVDVFLAGHLHVSHFENTTARYHLPGYAGLIIQAGSATSTRRREKLNAFNILRVDAGLIVVETHTFQLETASFGPSSTRRFQHGPEGWLPA